MNRAEMRRWSRKIKRLSRWQRLRTVVQATPEPVKPVVVQSRPTQRTFTMTPQEASVALKTTLATLEHWRRKGTGPDFTKVGNRVYYDKVSVRQYK